MTYGSYRLGVHAEDADIDTVCLLPRNISRQDFFDKMRPMLLAEPGIESLNAVQDSFVPVMKFKFFNIHIDLVCTILPFSKIPENLDANDPSLLRLMDLRCIRSLNGTRVADELLRLVPNVDTFQIALRCIKLWATKRAIYSNVVGFLGGVAWAILVARVCQLYPNVCASTIVSKFFRIIGQWNWPSPVLLKTIEEASMPGDSQPWNPRLNSRDREHKMPIITPSYPSMCATHNVTASSMKLVIGELKSAAEIVDRVMIGSASWNDLFVENNFFQLYQHYIQVVVSADDHDSLLEGSGLVESRLRQLLMKLETSPQIALAHPFIEGIEDSRHCSQKQHLYEFIGADPPTIEEDRTTQVDQTFYSKTFYVGLYVRFEVSQPRDLDISHQVNAFVKQTQLHDGFDKKHMKLNIRYMNRSNLPQQLISTGSATMKRAYKETTIPDITSTSANLDSSNKKRRSNPITNEQLDYPPSSLPDMKKTLSVPSN
ncbi:unnamed protein product [Absidia cylindrospora]